LCPLLERGEEPGVVGGVAPTTSISSDSDPEPEPRTISDILFVRNKSVDFRTVCFVRATLTVSLRGIWNYGLRPLSFFVTCDGRSA
jgi:hypothetical protein